MTPTDPADMPHESEPTQEQRATQAIMAIMAGSNPAAEALVLANDFTDRQTAKLSRWVRRSRS